MSSLKAWLQDPDDWKVNLPPRNKPKSWLEILSPWLMAVGIVAFAMLANALVELI